VVYLKTSVVFTCSYFINIGVLAFIPLILFVDKKLLKTNRVLLASIIIFFLCGIEKSFLDYPRLAGTFIVLFGFLTLSKGEMNGVA
jgi:hypothetical protein